MQRFKKEFTRPCKCNPLHGHSEDCLRILHWADDHFKFVYGANGTLTQAARWRIEALWQLQHMREGYCSGYIGRSMAIGIRALLHASRRGGCRLPA